MDVGFLVVAWIETCGFPASPADGRGHWFRVMEVCMSDEMLVKFARELLEQEMASLSRHHHMGTMELLSPATLRSLVELLGEDPSRPAALLEPVVHRLMNDSQFVDGNGDSVLLDAAEAGEAQVDAVLRVLEQVRQRGLRDGVWCVAPVTPMMFG
jgi:hypothetical protein